MVPLSESHPQLAQEMHPIKNSLKPENVSAGQNKKVWWLCAKDARHEWEAKISNRAFNNNGCPICSGRQVCTGINDLATTHPHISQTWHPQKNDKTVQEVTGNSNQYAWWVCSLNHEWRAPIAQRLKSKGCPYCINRKILVGFNDLATVNPELAKEWHPTKNTLTPQEVTISSGKRIWWQCSQKHEWEAYVYSRLKAKCPVCAGKQVWAGYNDLATTHPHLVAEWHESNQLSPTQVMAGSSKQYTWICPENHTWITTPEHRTRKGEPRGCPICSIPKQTSKTEQKWLRLIEENSGWERLDESLFKKIVKNPEKFRTIDGLFRCGNAIIFVEYDGLRWHDDMDARSRDIRKTQVILDSDPHYYVLRLRDTRLEDLDFSHERFYQCQPVNVNSLLAVCSMVTG